MGSELISTMGTDEWVEVEIVRIMGQVVPTSWYWKYSGEVCKKCGACGMDNSNDRQMLMGFEGQVVKQISKVPQNK